MTLNQAVVFLLAGFVAGALLVYGIGLLTGGKCTERTYQTHTRETVDGVERGTFEEVVTRC